MGGDVSPIYARPHLYVAHPHLAALPNGEWVMVANRGPRRETTLHPPHDPDFCNILVRSADQGRSWSAPSVVGEPGTECAGLTVLGDGVLLLNQWRFRWYASDDLPAVDAEPWLTDAAALRRERFGSTDLETGSPGIDWARGGGATTVRRSTDAGRQFGAPATLDVAPYSGGYGMRGAAVLPDGTILLPLCDVPHYRRVFAVRSGDDGHTWQRPEPVAEAPGRAFEEPAPIVLKDGTILLLLRENVSCTLYAVRSDDAGKSWSEPMPTGIDGYPAHILALPDGRLVAIVGCRAPPCRIAAFFSSDSGRTWDPRSTTIAHLPHPDLGYPTAALRGDDAIFVAWYHRGSDGVTGLYSTTIIP